MPGFDLLGQMSTRLGQNFDTALDQPALLPIGFESLNGRVCKHGAYAFDRFHHVGQPRDDRVHHG